VKFTAEISEYLLPEEIYSIIDAIENPRDKLWVRTAWETGGRVSEVSSLTRPNILRKENALILQNLKQNKRMVAADERAQGILPENKPKTPPDLKRVYIFGTSTLTEDLTRYCRRHGLNEYIFLNKYGDPISRQYIFKMFKATTEMLDIRRIKVNPNTGRKENLPAWCHLIRHSTGMYLFSMTGSLEVVAKHLGHSSIQSTEAYAGLTDNDHKKILGGIMG